MAFDLSLDPELQPPYRCIPDLANGNVQFSLSLLSRLSAASIDPYTVALGLYVGSYFQLSSVGRRNIESSLSKLGAFSGVGEVLSFGFGPQHVVRSISATEQGATLVALCATLSECFSVDVSAEIISSIVSADVDAKSLPAMSHWHSLVRSCSGIFAGASFPLRAEKFMALHGLDSGSETTDLVDALKGVGRVSQGLEQSIAIVGSREAGFVAAFAEWLFGHTVTITDEHGTLRYSSCAPGSTPQIQVFYREPDRDVDFGPQVTCKLYILRPLSVPVESDSHSPVWGSLVLDSQVNWPRRNTKPVGGRVRWDKCLFATFGSSFEKLMKTSDVVGEIILGAAFIFEAIAKADSDVPKYLLRDSELYLESSFGKGFVHTALDRLPELAATGVNMHKARRATSFSEALNNYKHCFTLLARSCGCYNCDDPPRYHHVPPPTDDECLLVIIGTIIKVCRLLSRIEVFDSLYPSINGLQRFREDQRTRRWHLGPDYALRGYGILPEHNFRCMALEDAVCLFTNAVSDMAE